MSNRKCCVPGCLNSLDTNANLHKFPNPAKDKELFNTWVYSVGGDILQLENEYIFKYRRVCREHFDQKYWCRNNRLSKEAVPTKNMPGLSFSSERSVLGPLQMSEASTSKGIPLHHFPNPDSRAEKFNTWISKIGGEIAKMDNLVVYTNRRVCHKHFEEIDKYPRNRLCRLAIPVLYLSASKSTTAEMDLQNRTSDDAEANYGQDVAESCADAGDSGPVEEPRVDGTDICDDDDDDSDTLVESNVCRVCLALDVKMYDLKDIELREMFQNITGIVVPENNHSMLERLCWECAGRLKAAATFRNKALLSNALLQGLANTGEQIRKNDVTLIKENQDYLKSAGTLSIVEVFHIVDIDAENESVPSISENNYTDIVQNTVRKDSIGLKQSIIKENNDQMDVEDESMIKAPIKTVIEYDPVRPNTDEINRNIVLETNPPFSNNIPRENTSNSAYSSLPPGCSRVETKDPMVGYLLKTPSDYENKIKKTVIKITKQDSISKMVSKKSKEVINHDKKFKRAAKLKNINLKVKIDNSKKTLNQKLVKKTQDKTNTSTDEEYTDVEYLNFENYEF